MEEVAVRTVGGLEVLALMRDLDQVERKLGKMMTKKMGQAKVLNP